VDAAGKHFNSCEVWVVEKITNRVHFGVRNFKALQNDSPLIAPSRQPRCTRRYESSVLLRLGPSFK